jgi:hypothetical protein
MVIIYPEGGGKGAFNSFFNPFILSGSIFTLRPYPTILAKVTIYPARFITLFRLYQGRYSHEALAFVIVKQTNLCSFHIFHNNKNFELSIIEPARVNSDP